MKGKSENIIIGKLISMLQTNEASPERVLLFTVCTVCWSYTAMPTAVKLFCCVGFIMYLVGLLVQCVIYLVFCLFALYLFLLCTTYLVILLYHTAATFL